MVRSKHWYRPLGHGYTGPMYLQRGLLPQAKKIRASPTLSREAKRRLRWMEYYLSHGRNAKLTYRHFGISSATFYRWWHRYDPRRLESLEDDWGTRRPHAVRQPETPPALEAAIRTVREHYPRWGKVKLRLLLRRDGWTVSESTVGRTLTRLRAKGQLREPAIVRATRTRWRRRRARPYAQRFPWGYVPQAPGDLVEIDATPIEVLPGLRRIHFTARDVVSRKDVLAAYKRQTSQAAARVLREAFARFGFPVRAIQIDGGSEFKATFEAACAALRIKLFVLPPRSPRLNGHVERAHRTHQEEFYDLEEIPERLDAHNVLLRHWEETYNNVRPHQALGYLTPNEYVARWEATHKAHTK
ncbi:MAG: transposase [Bacillati bacterium ANGP1]|uniref:Transposase n=1 Tax=Candidatus Segetimicrobium genomatis TaxID=2569760 RepID=A0A537LNJ5_9BACT|nr:MAG: transposase [Terrabacteria group bacterium ANGP1]